MPILNIENCLVLSGKRVSMESVYDGGLGHVHQFSLGHMRHMGGLAPDYGHAVYGWVKQCIYRLFHYIDVYFMLGCVE